MSDGSTDLKACEAILRRGSRSFHFASRLLPARLRGPTAAVYAFCRVTDTFVDAEGASQKDLADVVRRLDRIYEGRPADDPVDRAFAEVVDRFDIPRTIPDALVEGYAWDLEGRSYEVLPDVYAYCVRVGSTVGLMMCLVMEVRGPATLARAADLGVAMQLTNIARDVGEDARRGRVYLPRSWLPGLPIEEWMRAPRPTPIVREAVRRLLAAADGTYVRAGSGIEDLPADCRLAIRAALLIYEDIGTQIRDHGYDSVTRRAYTSLARKVTLLYRAARPAGRRMPDPSLHGGHGDALPSSEYDGLIASIGESRNPAGT